MQPTPSKGHSLEYKIMRLRNVWVAIWVNALSAVCAAEPLDSVAGQLLYDTHCTSCHTTQIHWRDRHLATDWASLQAQVKRWQSNSALGWKQTEVMEVTRYLNDSIYHFEPSATAQGTDQKQFTWRAKP
jgi:mono/diheme cytochrome c family protein